MNLYFNFSLMPKWHWVCNCYVLVDLACTWPDVSAEPNLSQTRVRPEPDQNQTRTRPEPQKHWGHITIILVMFLFVSKPHYPHRPGMTWLLVPVFHLMVVEFLYLLCVVSPHLTLWFVCVWSINISWIFFFIWQLKPSSPGCRIREVWEIYKVIDAERAPVCLCQAQHYATACRLNTMINKPRHGWPSGTKLYLYTWNGFQASAQWDQIEDASHVCSSERSFHSQCEDFMGVIDTGMLVLQLTLCLTSNIYEYVNTIRFSYKTKQPGLFFEYSIVPIYIYQI